MSEIRQIKVTNKDHGRRVKDVCLKHWSGQCSQEIILKALFQGKVTLDGKKAKPKQLVQRGQTLKMDQGIKSGSQTKPIHLPILFEDDFLLIVNKPAGIAVNGNRGNDVEKLVNKFAVAGDLDRIRAVHRIDVPTAGIVVLAKTKRSLREMGELFMHQQVDKTYLAIVQGRIGKSGKIDEAINGKHALTRYERIAQITFKNKDYSIVSLHPSTGRTHQLRIHLQNLGHSILGDDQYGPQPPDHGQLMLCAHKIAFEHPMTPQKIDVTAPLPKYFNDIWHIKSKSS